MKIRTVIAIVFQIVVCPLLVQSQTIYFNNRYDLTHYNSWDYSSTILQTLDGYLIYSETGAKYDWRTLSYLKLDFNGNIIWIKTIGDTMSEWSLGYPGSLLNYCQGIYYSTGLIRSYTTTWVHDRGLLIKYNSEFDTLWKKEYGEHSEPYDTSYLFRNICRVMDGGIVLTGSFGNESGATNAKAYLMKTDSSGNKLWEHTYANLSGDVQGYSVIQTSDGGYAIGAFQYYHVPPPNETGDPIVIKTDSAGNFEWMRNLGSNLMDTHAMVANSVDGNILALSAFSDSVSGGDEWAKKIHLVKLANNNQVLFDRMYNRKIYMLFTHSVHCNPDGSIICSGSTGTINSDYPFTVGWLFKTNSDGDSLWYREYQKVGSPNSFSSNVLYNVIPTFDNGYISCGFVNPILPDTGTQDVWVVKVDSMGCESPANCWVSTPEALTAAVAGQLLVYPNPSKDAFIVTFTSGKGGTLCFFDLYGRIIYETNVQGGMETAVIPCTDWPSGMYIGKLTLNGRIVAVGKVVVR